MNAIITLKCVASKLTKLASFEITENYYKNIYSEDHEFWLNVGESYFSLGLITMSGVPHFYVFSKNAPSEVEVKPAVLFDLDWSKIPNDWYARIHENTRAIEIVPKELAETKDWFEKYLDEDEETLRVVNGVVSKILDSKTEIPNAEAIETE